MTQNLTKSYELAEFSLDEHAACESSQPELPHTPEQKARWLLQHGSTREVREFLEQIPGTPENQARAKRERLEKQNRHIEKKRKEARRRKNRLTSKARARNRSSR